MDNDDIVNDPNQLLQQRMIAAIKDIGDSLEKLYPGWGWLIEPDASVIKVAATRCNPQYGFYLTDRSMRGAGWSKETVMRMAGELLERFGMPRVPFFRASSEYWDAKRRTRHPMGWLLPDMAGRKVETSGERRDQRLRGLK